MSDQLATLAFEARDVTGIRRVDVSDVQPSTPAGAVATALAERMALPDNVPWSLRDSRSRALDDRRPIGEQVEAGEHLTVTPRAHLG
jgi:hypothetical protein